MRRYAIIGSVIAAAIGLVSVSAQSPAQVVTLAPGASASIVCEAGNPRAAFGNGALAVDCVDTPVSVSATPTATIAPATPTTTPMPAMTGVCGESMMTWHPPVVNGCATGHEHGDAPPQWVADAGYTVSYHFHGNTSPLENTTKHAAMKGFSARFNGVDLYLRIHAASNPGDRVARYHSYEMFARDATGAVSHWQGWYNSGDPVTSRIPRRAGVEVQTRPVILVVDATSAQQGINCEQWYTGAGEPTWGWDFGWTICNSTTLYTDTERLSPYDVTTWQKTNDKGLTRRLEAAWYGNRSSQRGAFYATQFGEIVNGPTDTRCSGVTVKYGVSYPNVCLSQYIAPSMPDVKFPGNAAQKQFDGTGVTLPN